MDREKRNTIEVRLAEIGRLINDFQEKFEAGVADADNFITINEIERMWGELQNNTNNIYNELIQELLNSIDERDLIRKKKESSNSKE
jgi:hypothetical protein